LYRRYINDKINQIYSQGARMSLQHIAKHLETKGRGNDTELIHMSKKEIGGLQALAKAHGGTLTRNPETGLYEAGFLEQILPIVAAGAAMYFTAGAATPMLMSAGMGATSAGILAGAGAGALIGGGSAAIQGGDVGKGALMGGVTGALGGGLSAGLEGLSADPNAALQASTEVGTNSLNVNPSTGAPIDPLAVQQAAADPYAGLAGTTPPAAPPAGISNLPSSVPQQAAITPQQAATLKSTDTDLLDRLAAQKVFYPKVTIDLLLRLPVKLIPQ